MFTNIMYQEYDILRENYGEDQAFFRYEILTGRLVLVHCREENSTRLFVESLFDVENVLRKNGWWNTFTICEKPQNIGYYIAEINNVRKDKDGYPIFVVNPILAIDPADIKKDLESHQKSFLNNFFLETGMFTETYPYYTTGGNFTAIARKLGQNDIVDRSVICSAAMTCVLAGSITLKEIINLMASPTDSQIVHENYVKMLTDFTKNREQHRDLYPHLVEKLDQAFNTSSSWSISYKIEDFIYDLETKYLSAEYSGKISPVEGDIFDKIESYLVFDANRKALNKASKAAAKKAKKAAAKANKNPS